MPEEKTYRLARSFRGFLAFALVLFVVVVGGILSRILRGTQPVEGIVFFILWLIFAVSWFIYHAYTGVISIIIEDDTITFRTLFRTRRVAVGAIVLIGTNWWDINRFMPYVRHTGGKLRLLGPFDDFHDLLNLLKERNPSIEIKRL
jgi:hypothetical protein